MIDYLKRVPGIQVITTGGSPQVRIRNGISIVDEQEPLHVIDNIPVGNDYITAESYVDVNDIRSISVLKDVSSTNRYGFQGANGGSLSTQKNNHPQQMFRTFSMGY